MNILKYLTTFSVFSVAVETTLPASAFTINYQIENITFDDGTSVMGSFNFNTANDSYSNISIETEDGIILENGKPITGSTYTDNDYIFLSLRSLNSSKNLVISDLFKTSSPNTINTLSLSFASSLDQGGTISIDSGTEGNPLNGGRFFHNIDSSQLVEQSRHTQPTQSVPFKGKGTMSLVALGGYLGYRYFRKRKS